MAHTSHTDPTRLPPVVQLPPFRHLISQDWLPRDQYQPFPSSLPTNFHSSNKNEPMPSAQMQENRSTDDLTANVGLAHNASILLASHDEPSTNLSQPQATTQPHHSPTPPPSRYHLPEPSQSTTSNLIYSAARRITRTEEATADAIFLLKILHLRDLDHIPPLCDLHSTPRIEPSLLDRITTSLLEMSFSPETIILAAALISRAATLRRLTPIFPHDCAWYSEASTPEATLVIALRVAQLYFTQEPLDGREFYPLLGFYPYDEMASFARRFGVLVFKAPIAVAIEGLGLQAWRALKRDFERGRVHGDADGGVEAKGYL